MTSTELLGTYLNDHLAGANAGVDLAENLHGRVADRPEAATVDRVVADIRQDRDELQAIVAQIGESGHGIKQTMGWLAGKTHRLALAEPLTGDEHLSLLLVAESLAVGIDGKAALWEALQSLVGVHPVLAGVDFARLLDRAHEQRGRVEQVRLAAARRAFAGSTPPDV